MMGETEQVVVVKSSKNGGGEGLLNSLGGVSFLVMLLFGSDHTTGA